MWCVEQNKKCLLIVIQNVLIFQAQPIPTDITAKLLGNRVAVSPIVTIEPRRRKFHKPITLTIPVPQAANKGMINQYSGDAPTLRLLCSITGTSFLYKYIVSLSPPYIEYGHLKLQQICWHRIWRHMFE